MIFGVTGTRLGINVNQWDMSMQFFQVAKISELHQGCCVGADEELTILISELFPGIPIIGHPPIDKKLISQVCLNLSTELREEKVYTERNKDIVNEVEFMVCCPDGPEKVRSGTWQTIRFAAKIGRSYMVLGRE